MPTMKRTVNHAHVLRKPGVENDDMSPPCYLCGKDHVGVLEETHVMLPGSFSFSEEHGVPIFIIDPEVNIHFMALPNGQLAFVTDYQAPGQRERICATAHTDCVDRLVEEIFDDVEEEEEDDTEEVDEEAYPYEYEENDR